MKERKTALITGASKGLGFQLAQTLAQRGWRLIINARNARLLLDVQRRLEEYTEVFAISGDVRDEIHLLQFEEVLKANNFRLDLVVNNASTLGISPLEPLLSQSVESLHQVFHTNVIAPISLLQKTTSYLKNDGAVINVSSDAAVEAYETWGGYSGSKAALDHMTRILAKENPQFHWYAFDPGDMRTDLHQAAFPGEDISDRPLPEESAIPALMNLIESLPESKRYSVESLKELAYENV